MKDTYLRLVTAAFALYFNIFVAHFGVVEAGMVDKNRKYDGSGYCRPCPDCGPKKKKKVEKKKVTCERPTRPQKKASTRKMPQAKGKAKAKAKPSAKPKAKSKRTEKIEVTNNIVNLNLGGSDMEVGKYHFPGGPALVPNIKMGGGGTIVPGTSSKVVGGGGTIVTGTGSTVVGGGGTIVPGTGSTVIGGGGTIVPGTVFPPVPGVVTPTTSCPCPDKIKVKVIKCEDGKLEIELLDIAECVKAKGGSIKYVRLEGIDGDLAGKYVDVKYVNNKITFSEINSKSIACGSSYYVIVNYEVKGSNCWTKRVKIGPEPGTVTPTPVSSCGCKNEIAVELVECEKAKVEIKLSKIAACADKVLTVRLEGIDGEFAGKYVDVNYVNNTVIFTEMDGNELTCGKYNVLVEHVKNDKTCWTSRVKIGPEPSEPGEPAEPTDPTDPSYPTDPTTPTDPTDPSYPTNPSTPSTPTGDSDSIMAKFCVNCTEGTADRIIDGGSTTTTRIVPRQVTVPSVSRPSGYGTGTGTGTGTSSSTKTVYDKITETVEHPDKFIPGTPGRCTVCCTLVRLKSDGTYTDMSGNPLPGGNVCPVCSNKIGESSGFTVHNCDASNYNNNNNTGSGTPTSSGDGYDSSGNTGTTGTTGSVAPTPVNTGSTDETTVSRPEGYGNEDGGKATGGNDSDTYNPSDENVAEENEDDSNFGGSGSGSGGIDDLGGGGGGG